MRSAAIIVLGCLYATGCASQQQVYSTPLSPQNAAVVAYDIVVFTETQTKPKGEPIAVMQPAGDTTLTPALIDDLSTVGYTVKPDAKLKLLYSVSTMPEGTFLRVSLGSASAAKLYHEEPGAKLAQSGPFTVVDGGVR